VPQLAGLLGPAALKRFGLALRATAIHPSAEALRALAAAAPPSWAKKIAEPLSFKEESKHL